VLASAGTITLNLATSNLLRKFRLSRLVYSILIISTLNVGILFFTRNILVSSIQFIIFDILACFLYTLCSLILEEYSKDLKTGRIRGLFNAILSSAYLLAPFFSSIFIVMGGLKIIFLMASFFGFAATLFYYLYLYDIPKITVTKNGLKYDLQKLFKSKDLKGICFSQFGLTVFYALIVIYAPFKLESEGITLVQYLSVALPIALSPFLILPPLIGALEDKFHDEKEVLLLSYLGLIFSMVIFAFCESSSLLTWTLVLLFTRACASCVEISNASYLFKKIDKEDVGIITFFSSLDYIAMIIFTPIFSLLLYLTDIKTLFLSISFFLCFVLVYVSRIHDAKNYQKHKLFKTIFEKSRKRVVSN
jgi:MFS family permease